MESEEDRTEPIFNGVSSGGEIQDHYTVPLNDSNSSFPPPTLVRHGGELTQSSHDGAGRMGSSFNMLNTVIGGGISIIATPAAVRLSGGVEDEPALAANTRGAADRRGPLTTASPPAGRH